MLGYRQGDRTEREGKRLGAEQRTKSSGGECVCGFAAGCSRVERWVSVTAAFYLCYRFGFGFLVERDRMDNMYMYMYIYDPILSLIHLLIY